MVDIHCKFHPVPPIHLAVKYTSFTMFFIFKSKSWNYCWKACNRQKIKEFGKFSGLAELWSVHTRNLGRNLR